MTDELVKSYKKEFHFPLNTNGVVLKYCEGIWSVSIGDEDEMIVEDLENGIKLEDFDPPYVLYHQSLVTLEVLNIAKSILKEEENKDERS